MSYKLMRFPLTVLLTLSFAACQDDTTGPVMPGDAPSFGVGNDLPNGSHFTLNIHGVKDKQAAMDAANDLNGRGSSIFVALYFDDGDNTGECWDGACPIDTKLTNRKNKILLEPGDNFAVLDANATDADGALFRLPSNVAGNWAVYARPLGKPGGTATVTTCATFNVDPDGVANSGDEYEEVLCSLNNYIATRSTGKPRTENVTSDLLYVQVYIDPALIGIDPLTTCLANAGYSGTDDVPLFDSCFEQYFWDYDNNGLKLLQLRFYPIGG